jgi:hypothetical protein
MTNQSTIDKLIEMHMTSMADAFRNQMQDISMKEIPFDDRFGMIVDIEYTSRKNSRLKRLIKNAEFEQPDATIAAVDYGHNRKVNRHLIERLSTSQNTVTSSLPAQQAVEKHIWPVRLEWRHVSVITALSTSVCQICSWTYKRPEMKAALKMH